MTSRIEKIQAMLARDPDDVFLNYSLGMECASVKRFAEAVAAFNRCIELDGEYLPAYVEVGKALRSVGDYEAAREIFAAGLEVAARQGQHHVHDYITQQINGLPRSGKDVQ